MSILSNILKTNFNFTLIYSDKYYFSEKTQNEKILQKMEKTPISFDLSKKIKYSIN